MSGRFITYVIIGVAFGFTQLWFVYWVVKLFKEKQRILKERSAAGKSGTPSRTAHPSGGSTAAQSGAASPPNGTPATGAPTAGGT
jgi:hypothetical protein